MTLLSLPDDLLACLLKFGLTIDLSHAARACSRLRAAAEAASEQVLNSEAGPKFVPLGESYGRYLSNRSPFTWRTRLALSLPEEAYEQTFQLVQLQAGLIVVGCSSWREGDQGALAETLGLEPYHVTQLATDNEPALAAEVSPYALSRAPDVAMAPCRRVCCTSTSSSSSDDDDDEDEDEDEGEGEGERSMNKRMGRVLGDDIGDQVLRLPWVLPSPEPHPSPSPQP